MIGIGVISLLVFIGVIVIWNAFLKRSAGESMLFGYLATLIICILGGADVLALTKKSFADAFTERTLFAVMAFCFMAYLMQQSGIITRLVHILNSIFGRLAGGAGYVSTLASALMGMVAGSGSGNAAVSGAITIPWMNETGFSKELSTVIVTGNATLGSSIPPSNSIFVLLAMPVIAGAVQADKLYIANFCAGVWVLLVRLLVVFYYTKKYHIQKANQIRSLKETLKEGGTSIAIFLGILLPLFLTTGPLANFLKAEEYLGKGVGAINIIVCIPICLIIVTLIEGRKHLPRAFNGWAGLFRGCLRNVSTVGGAMFFAYSGASIMTNLGLQKEMDLVFTHLQNLGVPVVIMLLLIGVIIMVLAGPLTSVATLVASGSVCFTALTAMGVNPLFALSAIIVFSATEGCTPPSSAPLYVAAGISGVEDPNACFKPLILHYAGTSLIVGTLIGLGLLPIIT